jgi:hypothetical protein
MKVVKIIEDNTTTKPLNQNRMKTAMQKAFEHQKLWIESGFTLEKWFENYEQSHLKKEKEQIMDANEEGFHSGQSMAHNGTCFFESPKDYYNKTFKSE